eukprot:TRINITY_DN584_c0_g1_i1.p1 TRINITY_DN584_c0_g1~~TRINITY_DN584_c0_g1_i1.p1  ORF type:complete len:154 (+),score=87.72 TRINITY_DN584_c0_g1_i1:75-536(+)
MIHFVLMISTQGKLRLAKFYSPFSTKEKEKAKRDLSNMVIGRNSKLCNFLEWNDYRILWRRYASLYIIAGIDKDDNELMSLEILHHFVETLDNHFNHVCELDLIFNFPKVYYLLDEVITAGELQESAKSAILREFNQQEGLIEQAESALQFAP